MNTLTYRSPLVAQTLFAALLGSVVGAGCQLQQADLWPPWMYACLVPLALVLLAVAAIKNIANMAVGWRAHLVVGLALAMIGFSATGLRAGLFLSDALDPILEGRDVQVTGLVASLPQRNDAAVRFRLQIESARLDGKEIRLPALADVGWYGGAFPAGPGAALGSELSATPAPIAVLNRMPPMVRAGDRWQMTLRLKAPHGARNSYGFDYELWLWEQGVQVTGYVRAGAKDVAPQWVGATWTYPVARLRQAVREAIDARIENRQLAGLIAALVIGDQAAIDRTDWDVFRATGVAHLVSISGLHITLLAWMAAGVSGWLWRRSSRCCLAVPAPEAGLVLGVAVALVYSALAGWGVPAQRTCLMLATVAVLRLAGARWPWPWVWMLACAVVVASDPWALLQAGFWLSFVAVGVLFATDLGAASARPSSARGHLLKNFREQWVITVALAPLTLLLFGQVSVVGLLANMLAIPWVTLVVTPMAMLGTVVAPLWDVAAWAIQVLLTWLQWLASWPGATLSVAVAPWGMAVLGSLGGLLLVTPLPQGLRVLGLPLLVPVLLWQSPSPAPGEFELLAPDIGQGNSVLVRTAQHALMFDAGPRFSLESDAGHRVLVPLLQALQVPLDRVVLSHRDIDHVGGAQAVLAMQPQAELMSSIEANHPLQALRASRRCEAGLRWDWDGVEFEVLHPLPIDYETPVKPNALSCVLRIRNGRQTALLTGDIEQAQEARLVASEGDRLRADVLLVPHHGSNTSSTDAFLDAVAPRLAIVQAGYRNRFGHPTARVMARYAERKITVVDSPHCGAFLWQSWVPEASLSGACWRTASQRYWHHRVP